MLTTELIALALMRFGFARSGGIFEFIALMILAGILIWALTSPPKSDAARSRSDAAKNG